MGFNLKLFFVELIARVESAESHMELLEFVKEMEEYAKDCGQFR